MLFYKVFGDCKYFNICLFGEMIVLYDFINDFVGLVNMDYSGCCWMIVLVYIKDNEICFYVESSWIKFVNF